VDAEEQLLALQLALKCADLGHLAAPRSTHLKWVVALEEELFRQVGTVPQLKQGYIVRFDELVFWRQSVRMCT